MTRTALILVLTALLASAASDDAKIMRPADHSALSNGQLDVAATAPNGKLELDGKPLDAEQPFPNVFHAKLKTASGLHTLALIWPDGRKEIQFFSGPNAPAGFAEFHQHPPVADVPCTQCHELSKRGRFRFAGGCFTCHQQEKFAKVHTHKPDALSECGMCHNAHGSTVKAHMLQSKEAACKLCHT